MNNKISSGEAGFLIALALQPHTEAFEDLVKRRLGPEALRIAEALKLELNQIEDEELRKQVQQYRETADALFGISSEALGLTEEQIDEIQNTKRG